MQYTPQSRRHWGAFGGLAPQTKLRAPPKLKYESVDFFVNFLSVKPPRTNPKSPAEMQSSLLKTFWRRFWHTFQGKVPFIASSFMRCMSLRVPCGVASPQNCGGQKWATVFCFRHRLASQSTKWQETQEMWGKWPPCLRLCAYPNHFFRAGRVVLVSEISTFFRSSRYFLWSNGFDINSVIFYIVCDW